MIRDSKRKLFVTCTLNICIRLKKGEGRVIKIGAIIKSHFPVFQLVDF